MALSLAERSAVDSSVVFIGPSGSGKETVSNLAAILLGKHSLNTGQSTRCVADRAHEERIIEDIGENKVRFRRGGADRVRRWLSAGDDGIHFGLDESSGASADIFFGREKMTERIHPKFRRQKRLVNLEPAAAMIATDPSIRPLFNDLWRHTVFMLGGGPIVAKRSDQFIPEVHKIVVFSADDALSAGYRLWRGVAACDSFADELEYIRWRNALHVKNKLEVVPSGALRIVMNPYRLFYTAGIEEVAREVLAYMAATDVV